MYLLTSILILVIVLSIPFGFEDEIEKGADINHIIMNLNMEDRLKIINLALAKISAFLTFVICFLIWL